MRDRLHGRDFRRAMIRKRLNRVKVVLLVLSGKGGVGKSVISATLAGLLARSGVSVGLMDADVYGPSSALLFGVGDLPKEEVAGLKPPVREGVKVMSVDLFAPGRPLPLTGQAATQIVTEMMALTDWGELDCLVVDMPPATGDVMLFLTSIGSKGLRALMVTMTDSLSTSVARRVLALLRSEGVQTVGVLGNMVGRNAAAKEGSRKIESLADEFRTPLLGLLPFDPGVAGAVDGGDFGALVRTEFADALSKSVLGRIHKSFLG